jgi:hypothetical protein
MVESLRKKQPDLKRRRIQRDKNPASVPPSGAPSWCLTREALEKYNRSIENIPTYDYDTDDTDHDISQDTENEESRKTTRKRKKKSKKKKKVKTSKHKN